MIMFPLECVPITGFPGYVWNMRELCLYSYKSGCLRKLPVRKPNRWAMYMTEPHYCISHLGRRRYLLVSTLLKLKSDYAVHTVPTLTPQQLALFQP
jgi:hypothetical protein